LLQAAAIVEWCLANDRADELKAAWEDVVGRGRGSKGRAKEGLAALARQAPELELCWV
jgi:hypothetical protein